LVADLAGLSVTDPALPRFLDMTEERKSPGPERTQPAAQNRKARGGTPRKDEAAECEAAKLADKVRANA
jgi:hypothetical protein